MEKLLTLDHQLCYALYDTSSQFTKLYANVLQPFGVTYPQYLVLLVLWEKDGITFKELGERLHLGTGTLTPMVKRMETNGWVKKQRATSDERKVCIFLQPKAIENKEVINQTIVSEVTACNIELVEYEQLMLQLKNLHEKLTIRAENKSS